jgi:hypothetical protein
MVVLKYIVESPITLGCLSKNHMLANNQENAIQEKRISFLERLRRKYPQSEGIDRTG